MSAGLTILLALAATGAAPKPESIAMRSTFSDTKLILHDWQIAPDGVITATVREPETIVPIPTKMVTRRSAPDPARYRRIAAVLAPVFRMSGGEVPCRLMMTDQYTYTARQADRPAVAVYDGCRQPEVQALAAMLRNADAQIVQWVAAAPIIAERPERP